MASITLSMGMYTLLVGFSHWEDVTPDTVVFSGARENIATTIEVGSAQDGTHLGSGDPGTDNCGSGKHGNNVKYMSPTTMKFWYYPEEDINDVNLATTQCTFRVHFNDGVAVTISGARVFIYNGYQYGVSAPGVRVYGFERGVGALSWTPINDGVLGFGGDLDGQRLDLQDKGTPATDHYWYVAMSLVPDEVGKFTDIGIGVAMLYS